MRDLPPKTSTQQAENDPLHQHHEPQVVPPLTGFSLFSGLRREGGPPESTRYVSPVTAHRWSLRLAAEFGHADVTGELVKVVGKSVE